MNRYLATLVLLTVSATTQAESGVLVERIPQGADSQVVLAIVRQAFIGRGWLVRKSDSSSVTATLDGPNTDASLMISIGQQQLLYDGFAHRAAHKPGGLVTIGASAPIPKRWLRGLQEDIAAGLATLPNK